MTWFGSLDLAYKYVLVFGGLLVLTISAGVIKVLYDRRRIKQATAKEDVEAGQKEDQMELNQREKDEGDLFGIRAIEAGYFAGIAQSRPTSRAGSVTESTKGTPSISASTLVGSLASPKIPTHSAMSSVTSIPLAHMKDRSRDSETLGDSSPRKSPPTIRLRPSEAELSGRINHNASVNMTLAVPSSPVRVRAPSSPVFGSSDAESEGAASPRSLSPRSANFTPEHYAPVPPQIPMPEGLRAALHSPELLPKSQSASLNYHSPSPSPANSAPPSPGLPPPTQIPSMPSKALRDEPRSIFPAYSERRRPSLPKFELRQAESEQSNTVETELPSSPVLLQPRTYQPTNHKREESSASSIYSDRRVSAYQHQRSTSTDSSYSYNYSFPGYSNRNSVAMSLPTRDHARRPSASGSLQPPESTANSNDSRFSDFYDAYYRHSQLNIAQAKDGLKRSNQPNFPQATIVEVPSPLPSPGPTTFAQHNGVAL